MDENARLGSALRLARNLCGGIAAFYVAATGDMRLSLSSAMSDADLAQRTGALARACLEHPAAVGDEAFYTAEPIETAGNPDDLLACVAIPVRRADEAVGVLGVVDTWLPDLDPQQLQGLQQLAGLLGNVLSTRLPATRDDSTDDATDDATDDSTEPGSRGAASSRAETPQTPEVEDASGGVGAGSEAFLGVVARGLPFGMMVVRRDGTIVFANAELLRVSGRRSEQVLGIDVTELLAFPVESGRAANAGWPQPSDLRALLVIDASDRRLLRGPEPGDEVPVEVAATEIEVPSVGPSYVVMVRAPQDSPARADAAGEFAGALLDAMEDGVVLTDPSGSVVDVNPAALEVMGMPGRGEVVGRHLGVLLGLLDLDGAPVSWGEHPLAKALGGHVVEATRLTVDRGGERRHVLTRARPLPVDGSTGAVVTLRDVTASVEEQQRLTELALRDPLTGLGNRHLLQDHLARSLRNDRDPRSCCAVILLDLDGFKDVNDRFGHAVGDDVLVLVARRIEHTLRASELVARLGGDEFVVACEDVGHSDVELMGERLRKVLAAPIKVGEHVLTIGASIGWATSDRRADTAETLIARADAEMYRHKAIRTAAPLS